MAQQLSPEELASAGEHLNNDYQEDDVGKMW